MSRVSFRLPLVMFALLAAAIVGCKPAPPEFSEKPDAAAQGQASEDAASGLRALSAEDRAAAEKQRVCPVTGAELGSMGPPLKVTIDGRTVFLCCEGCIEKLQKEPQKYLSKLKEGR